MVQALIFFVELISLDMDLRIYIEPSQIVLKVYVCALPEIWSLFHIRTVFHGRLISPIFAQDGVFSHAKHLVSA